ncbi:unnamed protein product, partial [Ectocarpus sp. 4 AP-2014]
YAASLDRGTGTAAAGGGGLFPRRAVVDERRLVHHGEAREARGQVLRDAGLQQVGSEAVSRRVVFGRGRHVQRRRLRRRQEVRLLRWCLGGG